VNCAARYGQPRQGRAACHGRAKQQRAAPGREPRRTGLPRAAAQACCEPRWGREQRHGRAGRGGRGSGRRRRAPWPRTVPRPRAGTPRRASRGPREGRPRRALGEPRQGRVPCGDGAPRGVATAAPAELRPRTRGTPAELQATGRGDEEEGKGEPGADREQAQASALAADRAEATELGRTGAMAATGSSAGACASKARSRCKQPRRARAASSRGRATRRTAPKTQRSWEKGKGKGKGIHLDGELRGELQQGTSSSSAPCARLGEEGENTRDTIGVDSDDLARRSEIVGDTAVGSARIAGGSWRNGGRDAWRLRRPRARAWGSRRAAPGKRLGRAQGSKGGWAARAAGLRGRAPSRPTTRGRGGGEEGQVGPRAGEPAQERGEGVFLFIFPVLALIHH
jgi:hypothetical protein